MKNELLQKVAGKASRFFENSSGSHDWSHTERVFKVAMKIAEKVGADLEVVGIAALLHDIGREEQDRSKGSICHAESGARLARTLLMELAIEEEKVCRVLHCIETHRFRGSQRPQSIEAKILFDADKLDSIGAVGIGRAFQFAGEVGARLHNGQIDVHQTESYTIEDTAFREFSVKLCRVKDSMLTEEGKKIAEERHRFMEQFFQRLNDEVEGRM